MSINQKNYSLYVSWFLKPEIISEIENVLKNWLLLQKMFEIYGILFLKKNDRIGWQQWKNVWF